MGTLPRLRRFRTGLLVLLMALLAAVPMAHGAETYKVGDAVEILFHNDVTRATVVAIDRKGFVLVEFPFAGTSLRRSFKPAEIRRALEPGTLTAERIWTDATGKFRIKAVLLSIDDKSVSLRKTDKSEVTLEIAKLSTADQALINKLAKTPPSTQPSRVAHVLPGEEPVMAGPPAPPVATFATDAIASWGTVAEFAALTPDPSPSYLNLQEGGAALPAGFFDEVTGVIPAGGKDGWLLATVGSDHGPNPGATRVVWCSLTRKKIEGQQLLPTGESAIDYHAPSRRLLTYSNKRTDDKPFGEPLLTVWEAAPTDKAAKPVLRWSIAGQDNRPLHGAPWGRLINGNLVLSRQGDSQLTLWDIDKQSVRYRLSQDESSATDPALSSGRKYLLVPNGRNVGVHEAESGKQVSMLSGSKYVTAVGISGDGRLAAVHEYNRLAIWDLTVAAAQPRYFQTAGAHRGSIDFLSDERLLLTDSGGIILYSLKHELPLWRYDLPHAVSQHQISAIVAPCLAYAAASREGHQKQLVIGAVKLPGPRVEEATAAAQREALLVLKPGSAVRLNVSAGEFDARVKGALEKKILANGWKLSPDAPNVITAEMKRGESKTKTYRSSSGFDDTVTNVTVAPAISELTIKVGETIAWHSATESHTSNFFLVREGETLQGEIDKQQRPNPEFFDHAPIPSEILDPQKVGGLGSTKVTIRGLEPQETAALPAMP